MAGRVLQWYARAEILQKDSQETLRIFPILTQKSDQKKTGPKHIPYGVSSVFVLVCLFAVLLMFPANAFGAGMTLTSSSPANGSTGVGLQPTIHLWFSNNVCDRFAQNQSRISLVDENGVSVGLTCWNNYGGDNSNDPNNYRQQIFATPNSPLQEGTTYRLYLGAIESNAGTLDSMTITFTTAGGSSDPGAGGEPDPGAGGEPDPDAGGGSEEDDPSKNTTDPEETIVEKKSSEKGEDDGKSAERADAGSRSNSTPTTRDSLGNSSSKGSSTGSATQGQEGNGAGVDDNAQQGSALTTKGVTFVLTGIGDQTADAYSEDGSLLAGGTLQNVSWQMWLLVAVSAVSILMVGAIKQRIWWGKHAGATL